MIPWPIALLALFYGVNATVSAATAWKIVFGAVDRPLLWPLAWLAVSAGAMFGLALLRPWGRVLAITGLVLIAVVALTYAGLFVMAGRPLAGLAATGLAGVQVVVIRYVRRPMVKALFTHKAVRPLV